MKPFFKRILPKDALAAALLLVSAVLLVFSFPLDSGVVDSEGEARAVSRRLAKRMGVLDGYMRQALTEKEESWLELARLPEDMVVYKYVGDSLEAWCNQFSLKNDDIAHRLVYPMFTNPKAQYESPHGSQVVSGQEPGPG